MQMIGSRDVLTLVVRMGTTGVIANPLAKGLLLTTDNVVNNEVKGKAET